MFANVLNVARYCQQVVYQECFLNGAARGDRPSMESETFIEVKDEGHGGRVFGLGAWIKLTHHQCLLVLLHLEIHRHPPPVPTHHSTL